VARESERVRVPAGEYDAVVVDKQVGRHPPLLTFWYARGVGLVKIVNGERTLKALKSFTQGKD
jgi:hypothetical protein